MMHGVKKSEMAGANGEEAIRELEEEEAPQIAHYQSLVRRVLALGSLSEKELGADMAAIMAITSEVLLLNPDLLTAWTIRRRALRTLFASGDWLAASQEMEFSVATIKANPKSYGAWYHRQWLIGEAMREAPEGVPIQHELALSAKLLDLDARNFHGWNYRWFLVNSFPEQVSLRGEFDFTTQMIYKNFSNYSAWHRRSVLVERLTSEGLLSSADVKKIISDDLKLLKSAYFTEPADQSAWFYLRWLLDFAARQITCARELIRRELKNIDELLAIEPDAPLALYTWSQLARKLTMKEPSEGKDEGQEKDAIKDKLRERLQRLCRLDPMRTKMYQSMMI